MDLNDLASLVGVSPKQLEATARGANRRYRSFALSKRSGGTRQIDVPVRSLKAVQRSLLRDVMVDWTPHDAAYGFVPGKSAFDHAQFHAGSAPTLRVDLVDFFPTIDYKQVLRVARANGLDTEAAHVFARLCCRFGSLPQGAPTSPHLANLVCIKLDRRFTGLSRKLGLRYSRYADDLALTGVRARAVQPLVREIIQSEGFVVNEDKLRFFGPNDRRVLCGYVVTDRARVPRAYRRRVRQIAYLAEKWGTDELLLDDTRASAKDHFLGRAAYVGTSHPDDAELFREQLLSADWGY